MAKKAKKVSAPELEEVKDLQGQINQILMNIGNAEVVKDQMITKHSELQKEWTSMTAKLEDKYGSVNISLEDGSITAVEKPKEALTKV